MQTKVWCENASLSLPYTPHFPRQLLTHTELLREMLEMLQRKLNLIWGQEKGPTTPDLVGCHRTLRYLQACWCPLLPPSSVPRPPPPSAAAARASILRVLPSACSRRSVIRLPHCPPPAGLRGHGTHLSGPGSATCGRSSKGQWTIKNIREP